jgi:hypothetical protein
MDPKPTSIDCDHWPAPSADDYYTLKRYEAFEAAADYVAGALASHPAVIRVALFGSVASEPRREVRSEVATSRARTQRLDLAVWLDRVGGLDDLRRLSAQALQRLWHEKEFGVAHHQVDIFLLDAKGKDVGRLCRFNQCPKHKPECRAARCGDVPFLQQHDDFAFDSTDSLRPDRIRVLFERH